MAAAKTIFLDNKFLNAVLNNVGFTGGANVYLALNTTTSTTSVPGTEVVDANYARQTITWSGVSAGVDTGASVGNAGNFFGAGAASGHTVVEVAVYDAITSGNELFYATISNVVFSTGDTSSLTATNVTFTGTGKPNGLIASLVNALVSAGTYTSPTTVYAALMTSNSTPSASGTEVVDTNYARQAITFGAASGGSDSSTGAVTFFGSGAASPHTITEVSLFDAVSGGNQLYYAHLGASRSLAVGEKATVKTGNFTATES